MWYIISISIGLPPSSIVGIVGGAVKVNVGYYIYFYSSTS